MCKPLNCGQVVLPHSSYGTNPQRPARLSVCLRKEEARKSLLHTLLDQLES